MRGEWGGGVAVVSINYHKTKVRTETNLVAGHFTSATSHPAHPPIRPAIVLAVP